MDNAAFRSLVSKPSQDGSNTTATFKKPTTALGSRARSSIPMTPRNVPGFNSNREFARQVAEQTSSNGEPPLKKFKASAAPKGTKLGAGYVDRTQLRKGQDEEDDRASRLNNLEEQLKLGQIDQAQFEALREQIGIGGDVSSTHLVKGLDWKLLQRVKRGEDVSQSRQGDDSGDNSRPVPEVDVDEELERALEKDVTATRKEKESSSVDETYAEPQLMTRDEILRRFKQERNGPVAPAVPPAPVLNDRFKKVGGPAKSEKKKFVESINGRRREVLIVTNKDGTTKRKTRWIDPEDAPKPEQQPLGMEVPAEIAAKHKAMLEAQAAEDDNEDIFADAGGDYDPLAGINSDSEESGDERNEVSKVEMTIGNQRRNYFSAGNETEDTGEQAQNPMTNDPTILAALKRAAQIRLHEEGTDAPGSRAAETVAGAKSSAFLAKLKESERQDAADLDYGFGESRFGDDDDDDAGLLYDDDEGDKKKSGRKRGPKKRKGNKDNVQDVMSVLEGRNKKS